jgi:hypothetical protein
MRCVDIVFQISSIEARLIRMLDCSISASESHFVPDLFNRVNADMS